MLTKTLWVCLFISLSASLIMPRFTSQIGNVSGCLVKKDCDGFYKVFLGPFTILHRAVNLDTSSSRAFQGRPFHTQSCYYHLLLTNLFICGRFQTGVLGALYNFPSLLLFLSQLVENMNECDKRER